MLSTLLIIEDDRLFYPRFLEQLREDKRLAIAGLIIARAPRKHSRFLHGLKQLRQFRLMELVRLVLVIVWSFRPNNSLRAWAQRHSIPAIVASGSANTPEVIAFAKQCNAQFLLSASPLILKEELLSVCPHPINMHFSLLPAYKGIMPLFQAFAHGETESGISLHRMVRKVDEGEIVYQQALPLDYATSLMSNYQRFFDRAAQCVPEAFARIANNEAPVRVAHTQTASYFSHPTAEDWKKFRAAGGKFI